MTNFLNIFAVFGMLFASSAFAGQSTGGGSGVGLVSPGLLHKPGSLLLQVLEESNQLDELSEGKAAAIKALVNARVLGRVGRSTLVTVTKEGFDLLKESGETEAPVTDRMNNKEYVYSNATESSISLESVDSDDQVIILSSSEHP